MKILYADLEREWRGGQSQALLTVRGLRERGHKVEVLAAVNTPLANRVSQSGIRVHQVPRLGLRGWAAGTLRRLVSHDGFDLIHLNEPHALTSAWLARSHKKLPLLLSRRIGFPLWKNPVSQARYASLDRFVASSHTVAQSLTESGIPADKISIVNEGVIIPRPHADRERARARVHWGVKENQFLFGCIGVFVPEKGQRHLIQALPEVRRIHPEARLLLAGDGACRKELESLAKRLGQSEAVLFPGFVTNVDEVYAALDAFAFPSEFEGLGTALLAAMAVGLPCISSTRGALVEVADPGRTALVVEPMGTNLAQPMLRLIEDEALRTRLGEAARREIEQRFSVARMVEGTIGVYEEVLRNRQTA